jgi:hypothetical protein
MAANAATGPGSVRALIRPELWAWLDGLLITGQRDGAPPGHWCRPRTRSRLRPAIRSLARRSARLSGGAEQGGRGVAPVFVGTWGAVDLIRDPFADATSGGLRLTALATVDATAAAQLRVLTAARPWRSTLCDSFRPMTPEGAQGRLQRRRRRWFRQRTPGSRRATWGRYGRPDLGTARGRARGNLSAMWPCQSVSGKP